MSTSCVRRFIDERISRTLAVFLTAIVISCFEPERAVAEWRPAGAVTAGMLVQSSTASGGPALGGGLAADLWQSFGALRLGFYTGLYAITGDPADAMVFTPIAFSSAVVLEAPRASFEIRIRGGGFAGAVHDHGFVGGLYLGAGVYLDVAISDHALIGFGGDLHLLVATERSSTFDSRAFFAPGITLVYRPPVPRPPASDAP